MIIKKAKIHLVNLNCTPIQKGNWIDLKSSVDIEITHDNSMKYFEIPLGIITELPKWYKAEAKPRSSTFKNYGMLLTNSIGEIEHDYCGEWVFPALFIKKSSIYQGDRICQMQIKLREDAPWYYKILDLFTKIKIIYVNKNEIKGNRKGLGSTGK